MFRRLNFLITLASTSVALIIGLQLFWLVSLYQQEKSRFRTDVKNSIVEAVIATKLSATMLNDKVGISKELTDKLAKSIVTGDKEKFKKDIKDLSKRYTHNIGGDSAQGDEVLDTATVMVKIDEQQLVSGNDDLELYRKFMAFALNKREIKLPFELALTKDKQHFVKSTIDTNTFKKLFTVSADEMNTQLLGSGNTEAFGVSAGFQGVNWYFLSKMIWLLILSGIFIPAFIFSYVKVLRTFARQKKMSEIRTDFMNNMTHELKTPISAASVAIQLVADNNIRQESKAEYLNIAQSELTRLNTLVEKVLNMAVFENNKIEIGNDEISVEAWVNEVANSLKPIVDNRKGRIDVEILPASLWLQGDKIHLKNILYNLTDNAFKYNDKQVPLINIKAIEVGDSIHIVVADNGNGIPAQYLDKIFDKFFRVPSGDVHNVKGYGLGLSYVKEVVALHGGTISVSSTINEGSTFTIVLPKSRIV